MCPILAIFIHRGVSVKRHDNSEHSEESHRAQGRLLEGEKSRPFTCAQDDKINNLHFLLEGGFFATAQQSPVPPPPPPPVVVGGESYPINKAAVIAPWLALAAAIVAGAAVAIRRRIAQS